ncbi:glucose 1-dehydrogenase [Ahrensia sp. R2A130]|uniref:glucose 1-dehydrogenase n=1 Tax=Ahrensia sp. R2A130 TaxID=744979 RepID=UPI0001E083F5|nr:glucose 1-dehydrogenase [Ahrensia sp. R2A130]EFL89244.1 3-oxoacyl-(acyl-carrier-protein) reductase [Ahrensia sp. R2A130]
MRMEGKTAIVTGAGSGFGEAIATRFAEEGANVVIADIREDAAHAVASAIGASAVGIGVDVATRAGNIAMRDCAAESFGRLDTFVLNAGVTHKNQSALTVSEADFDLITAVNMKAMFHATQVMADDLAAFGGGSIIATASTAGLRPRPGLVWYNASKAWVINACKCLAVELAPRNIRVNSLCPVASPTAMLSDFMGEDTPEIREKFQAVIPLGRFSQPRDMANAALYLASDQADFITGVALEVDGGRCV